MGRLRDACRHERLYPEQRRLKWDNSDVPEFDLGEPLDELNFWEES
jgi:hypothetical protein